MFFPVGDEPNPTGVAWVNWALIVANVAAYVLVALPLSGQAADPNNPALIEWVRAVLTEQPGLSLDQVLAHASAYDLWLWEYGFRPAAPQLEDLFTSMFLHGGLSHLAGNMVFLWIFGDNVEARLGRFWYAVSYLAAGVAGSLAHGVLAAGSQLPMVGASGAISGVMGCYFLFFPLNRVRFLVLLPPFFLRIVAINARWVIGGYLVLDSVVPVLLGSQGPVAYGAHLGGFALGFVMAQAARWGQHGSAGHARALADTLAGGVTKSNAEQSAAAVVATLVDQGRLAEAAEVYLRAWNARASREVAPGDALVVADHLRAERHAALALAVYRRVLAGAPGGPQVARAQLGLGRVYLELMGQAAEAYGFLVQATGAHADATTRMEAQQVLAAIAQMQKLPLTRFRR